MCLAVPGKIESICGQEFSRVARVDFSGIKKEVSLACMPEANVGDYVLVHVGLAISKIDEAEAHQVFEYLAKMDELVELQDLSPDSNG